MIDTKKAFKLFAVSMAASILLSSFFTLLLWFLNFSGWALTFFVLYITLLAVFFTFLLVLHDLRDIHKEVCELKNKGDKE